MTATQPCGGVGGGGGGVPCWRDHVNVIFILILMSVIVSNEGPSERLMCQIFQKQQDEGSWHVLKQQIALMLKTLCFEQNGCFP